MSTLFNQTMQAVQIYQYGGAAELELQNIAIPSPQAGEVLVKVHAASVNPVDWKIREGYLASMLPHQLPLTLGWDVAGEIVAIGDGVTHWALGDAIYAHTNLAKQGSYAEYLLVSADEIAAKPASLNWQKAAAVPLVSLTAWQVLHDIAQIKAGESVLIQAGAGGVGIAAIQLAKLAGAKVYATASAKNIEFLAGLGADVVVDYQQGDFSQLTNLDMVFDTMGGQVLAQSWAYLKHGGRLVSIVEMPDQTIAQQYKANAQFAFVQPNAQQLTTLAQLIDEQKLQVVIDSVYALQDAVKAHQHSQTGHARGKVVLQVSSDC